MGTDIHGVFQRRTASGWEDVPSNFKEERHYQLFAVLAGVRNGTGFAGVITGEPIEPIANPRGLPADFERDEDDNHPMLKDAWESDRRSKYYKPGEDGYGRKWMGDHSHSWLTADEILAWVEKAPVAQHRGCIDWADWQTWDRKTAPQRYCGDVSGSGIKIISRIEAEQGKTGTHVDVTWHSPLRKELSYFCDEVAQLQAEYGDVRYVFGFDS